nr:retrovirus-related Pol polyprotein from transposon TNT 1-94 [Tanacetum cinerariifolium]
MKVKESLNVTFDEIPPSTKVSPLVVNNVGEEEAIINNIKVVNNNNNEEDESIEVDEDLVPLPMSQSVIGTKWVFRKRLDENGIVSRNRARLVAQGYNQHECIDYDETYAPVARKAFKHIQGEAEVETLLRDANKEFPNDDNVKQLFEQYKGFFKETVLLEEAKA